jgi:PPM family protein phosphatase
MSGEQGQGHNEPGTDRDATEPGGNGSAESSPPKRTPSTPLMEAAAKAAEEAHGSDADGKDGADGAAGATGGSERPSDAPEPATDAGTPPSDDETASAEDQPPDRTEASTDPPPDGESSDPREAATDPPAAGDALDKAPEAEPAGPGIRARYFGTTEVGLVREHNEDNFMVADLSGEARGLPEGTTRTVQIGDRGLVLAVCDGMGGAAAGEVASQMAVDTIHEVMQAGDPPADRDALARRLVHAIEEAGSRIFSSAKMDRSRRGMGTTATAVALIDEVLFVGNVGDSRAYVLRNGKLGLISKDQSLVNQLIEAGQLSEEEAEAFEHSNIILQALGTTEDVNVDLTFLELRRGDRVMLCSDGLSGLVHGQMIREVLDECADHTEACRKLVEMANHSGGHDNITIVVADFDGEGLASAEGAPEPTYQQYPLPPDDGSDAASLPPRDTRMKDGGPKPGADVKRGAAWGSGRDAQGGSPGSLRWWLLSGVVALAFVAIVVALSGPKAPAADEGAEPSAAAPPASQEPVQVTVRSDVMGAELFVDGKGYGRIGEQEDLEVFLEPGAYRLEARSEGSVVASASLTVQEGEPTEVDLMLPSGRFRSDEPGGVGAEPTEAPSAQEAAPLAPTPAPAPQVQEAPAPSGAETQKPAPTAPREPEQGAAPAPAPAPNPKPAPPPPKDDAPAGGKSLPDNPF